MLKSKTNSDGNVSSYEYNKNGAIVKYTDNTKNSSYDYDADNNRILAKEEYVNNQVSDYKDGAGNDISYKVKETNYIYNNNKLISSTTNFKNESNVDVLKQVDSFKYDNNGNNIEQVTDISGVAVSKTTLTNTYDGFNRLINANVNENNKITKADYAYDGDGVRRSKKVTIDGESKETNFLYDRGNLILESDSSKDTVSRYIFGNEYIGRIDGNEDLSYFMYNGHKDVVQAVDETGRVQNRYEYDVFGDTTLCEEEYSLPIRYTGQYNDNETNLYYLNARYYNVNTGRFLTKDTYAGQDNNTLSLNRYTYCYNNPINNYDPTGHVAQALGGLLELAPEILPELGPVGAGILAVGVTSYAIYEGYQWYKAYENTHSSSSSQSYYVPSTAPSKPASVPKHTSKSWSMPNVRFNIPNINIGPLFDNFDLSMPDFSDLSNLHIDIPEIDIDIPEIHIDMLDFSSWQYSVTDIDNGVSMEDIVFDAGEVKYDTMSSYDGDKDMSTFFPDAQSANPKSVDDYISIFPSSAEASESHIIIDYGNPEKSINDFLETFEPHVKSVDDYIISDDFTAGRDVVSIITMADGESQAKTTRVGRWMSQMEYEKMVETGYVQESFSGQTYVANPASSEAFAKQAKPGAIYVEFDVPTSSLKQTKDVWAKILGPNTPEARLKKLKGEPIPEMPRATNIRIEGGK